MDVYHMFEIGTIGAVTNVTTHLPTQLKTTKEDTESI